MARDYLRSGLGPLHVEVEFARYCDAADRLVPTPSVEQRIRMIAAALLQYGTLMGEEIFELSQ